MSAQQSPRPAFGGSRPPLGKAPNTGRHPLTPPADETDIPTPAAEQSPKRTPPRRDTTPPPDQAPTAAASHDDMTLLSHRVPSELARRFKIACISHGVKQQEGLRLAIEHWLDSQA